MKHHPFHPDGMWFAAWTVRHTDDEFTDHWVRRETYKEAKQELDTAEWGGGEIYCSVIGPIMEGTDD